jgi:hypothetical protein
VAKEAMEPGESTAIRITQEILQSKGMVDLVAAMAVLMVDVTGAVVATMVIVSIVMVIVAVMAQSVLCGQDQPVNSQVPVQVHHKM